MEEVQNRLRVAQSGRKRMADARAMEKLSQRPQLSVYDNEPEPKEAMEGAGMERLVGSGKKRGKKAAAAAPAGHSAEAEGVAFARHLKKLKGKEFFDAFHKGLMSGGAMEMECEEMSSSDEEMEGGRMPAAPIVPPGGVRARTEGNPPQAPKSFQRNSVALDRAARYEDEVPPAEGVGSGNLHITHEGAGKPKSAKRSARGQMIARLMKEEGLTLPQASKRLKDMK